MSCLFGMSRRRAYNSPRAVSQRTHALQQRLYTILELQELPNLSEKQHTDLVAVGLALEQQLADQAMASLARETAQHLRSIYGHVDINAVLAGDASDAVTFQPALVRRQLVHAGRRPQRKLSNNNNNPSTTHDPPAPVPPCSAPPPLPAVPQHEPSYTFRKTAGSPCSASSCTCSETSV